MFSTDHRPWHVEVERAAKREARRAFFLAFFAVCAMAAAVYVPLYLAARYVLSVVTAGLTP